MNNPDQRGSVLVIVVLVVLRISAVSIGGFVYFKNNFVNFIFSQSKINDISNLAPEQINNLVPQPVDSYYLPKGLTTNKFFYIKANNIYAYDLEKKETKVLTRYNGRDISNDNQLKDSNPLIYIFNLQVVDKDSLGFQLCQSTIETGDMACGIFLYNLNNLEPKEVELSQAEELKELSGVIQSVSWFDKNKFALAIVLKDTYRVYLVENNIPGLIAENKIDSGGDEYGVPESLVFSGDGNYLLHWSILLDKKDQHATVYNLGDKTKQVINNTAFPEWLDNKNIIYAASVGETKSDVYYYSYNIRDKTSKKIDTIAGGVFRPIPLKGKEIIAYMNWSSGNTMFYDFQEHKETTIIKANKNDAETLYLKPWMWVTPNVLLVEGLNYYYIDDFKNQVTLFSNFHESNFNLNDTASQYFQGYRKTDAFQIHAY